MLIDHVTVGVAGGKMLIVTANCKNRMWHSCASGVPIVRIALCKRPPISYV